ncbi:sodium/mannose cotransporter SLC5A10-like [Glandiceps talaboti]
MVERHYTIDTADYVVGILTMFVLFIGGLWSSRHHFHHGPFQAGRMSWWLVGLSLYFSNIPSSTFVGVSGYAAWNGIAVVFYEFAGTSCLAILAFVFVPMYVASGTYALPDYLEKRFGGHRIRVYTAIIQLLLMLFCQIAGEIIYCGSLFIQVIFNVSDFASVAILLSLTAIYAVCGGLSEAEHTEVLMAILVLFGALILMIICYIEAGSYYMFENMYMDSVPMSTLAGNTSCGIPSEQTWHLFRPVDSSLPWPGVLFGIHILTAYYFLSNRILMRKLLEAKNFDHAKAGSILAGCLKVLPMFLMVYPGMISRILYKDVVACVDPNVCHEVCNSYNGCSDVAYPYLILNLMPTVLKGIMVAAILAGVMSALIAVFETCSHLFVLDIWKAARPKCSVQEEAIVVRVVVIILVGLSFVWLPLIKHYGAGQIFVYVHSIASYLSPPLLAAYLLAIFWERVNEEGTFYGLLLALVVSILVMTRDIIHSNPRCDEVDTRPYLVQTLHYLHCAIMLFFLTLLFIVMFSLLTPPQPKESLLGLTWWTRHCVIQRIAKDSEVKVNREDEILEFFDINNIAMQTVDSHPDLEEYEAANVVCTRVTHRESESDHNELQIKKSNLDGFVATCTFLLEDDTDSDIWHPWRHGRLCRHRHRHAKKKKIIDERAMAMITLDEKTLWAYIVNISYVIMLAIMTGFVWGFYA